MSIFPLVLDTHAAIWARDGHLDIGITAKIDAAAKQGELLLSPISALEIGLLVQRGRLVLSQDVRAYVQTIFTMSGVQTAPLTAEIALASTMLPGSLHADPFDRILVATAAAFGAHLVTRDAEILAYAARSKHIRCVRC